MVRKVPQYAEKIGVKESGTYRFTAEERDTHINNIVESTKKNIKENEIREMNSHRFASKYIVNNIL